MLILNINTMAIDTCYYLKLILWLCFDFYCYSRIYFYCWIDCYDQVITWHSYPI